MIIGIYSSTGKLVGLGHLKRCLSIASELNNLGHVCEFILDDSSYSCYISKHGFRYSIINKINKIYQILIVDKYGLDDKFLNYLKKFCEVLVRVDDASPPIQKDFISDAIINGNPYGSTKFYDGVVKNDCQLIVGENFIPMDPKFCILRNQYRIRKTNDNIVITFGATINPKYPKSVALRLGTMFPEKTILLLNGIAFKSHFEMDLPNLELLPLTEDMPAILSIADIVICSASSVCWQLSTVGIPFITFVSALNQKKSFDYIKKRKIGIALDEECIENGILEKEISNLTFDNKMKLFIEARKTIQCNGSKRIAEKLIDIFDR